MKQNYVPYHVSKKLCTVYRKCMEEQHNPTSHTFCVCVLAGKTFWNTLL